MPDVSVIVPAGNAEATIGRTLAALAAQDYAGAFEVVVVDDASSDSTASVAGRAGVRVVTRTVPGGPAGARNSGVAVARGELLAFTDADCEPTPGWLSALVIALESADLVTGPVLPDPGVERGPFDRTLHVTGESPRFETANLAVRRDTFDQVGGFEPFAAGPGVRGLRPGPGDGHFGEDAVFGWRARGLGARIRFADSAVVHHAVFRRGPRGFIAERRRLRYFPALVAEVPDMATALPLRIFLSQRTMLFDLAALAVAVAVARRRPWPLVAVAPYVWRHLNRSDPWRRSSARHNLALLAADGVGAWALARGSAAARRPVL